MLPILKNPFNIPAHEEPVNERTPARTITHAVKAKRAASVFLEGVRVVPQGVWAAQLHVHESVRRILLGDFRAPMEGKTVNGDSIINQGAGTQDDRRRCEDFELQPRRRKGLQVPRLGEERERLRCVGAELGVRLRR